MVHETLLAMIRKGFALSLDGIHGEAHWERVRDNGLRLAEQTGADTKVVELFAYLHDSQRQTDGWDEEHGQRAADWVRSLSGTHLTLDSEQVDLLVFACAHHSKGLLSAQPTVQTCWDADRLDLGRVGIKPDPTRLCTPAARDPQVRGWAYIRSQR